MVVDVRVAHAAAVEIERVVQQVAIALRHRRQLLQEVVEQRDVELVDLRQLRHLLGVVAVVRRRVVRIRHPDLGIGPVARLAGELEGDDPGHVGLERQHLEIEHQPGVVGIGCRHADRPVDVGQRAVVGLGFRLLDAPLHLAHRVEVLADLDPVAGAQHALEAGDVLVDPVEQAGLAVQPLAPLGRRAALAEEPLEHDPGMRFGRQRRRRRRPGQVVLVDAGVAVVALADHVHQVHRQFERRQLGLLADLLRRDLIDRRAEVVVRALRPLRLRRAQEGRVRRGVGPGVGVLQFQVADHRDLLPEALQRTQGRRQFTEGAGAAGRLPARDVGAHRDVDEAQAPYRLGRRLRPGGHRRHHRVEQGQGDRRPHAAQEGPTREGLLGQDHDDALLIWKGSLATTA